MTGPKKAKTVLVVDDTIRILEITRYFLEQEGYAVVTTPDPVKGLEIARLGGIDVVILDIMMPGMNGYQVAEALQGDEKTRTIPIIMLTAKAVIEHTPKTFFYGMYGVMSKPFQRATLIRKVNEILELTAMQKEAEQKEQAEPLDPDNTPTTKL
ncbi:MAG: response regulator [Planctomycetota bacterium]|nr:response regulator [Planctomycetota bacterium]